MANLGPILAPLGPVLGLSRASLGPILAHQPSLGLSWAIMGRLGLISGPSWPIFPSSGTHLSPFWGISGQRPASMGRSGCIWGLLGALWAHFGPSRAKFGSLRSLFSFILKLTLRHLRSSFAFRSAEPKEGAAVRHAASVLDNHNRKHNKTKKNRKRAI